MEVGRREKLTSCTACLYTHLQGTNAHVLLQAAPSTSSHQSSQQQSQLKQPPVAHRHWQRSRLWVAPPLSAMALPAAASSGTKGALTASFECPLGPTGRLAFLWDHHVAGQVLLPGAALLEMAAAAATAMWLDSSGRHHSSGSAEQALAVTAVSILAPVVLQRPAGRSSPPTPLLLRCSIDCVEGTFKVGVRSRGFRGVCQHLCTQHTHGTYLPIGMTARTYVYSSCMHAWVSVHGKRIALPPQASLLHVLDHHTRTWRFLDACRSSR